MSSYSNAVETKDDYLQLSVEAGEKCHGPVQCTIIIILRFMWSLGFTIHKINCSIG